MLMDYKDKQEEIGKNKHFIRSFEFALTGIKTVYREERNMRTHTIVGILTIIAGIIFCLNRWEWLWLLLSIFLVLVMEMINTAFENVVDMVTDFHFHSIGKKIKAPRTAFRATRAGASCRWRWFPAPGPRPHKRGATRCCFCSRGWLPTAKCGCGGQRCC
mgnify:CR=1 FL=1